MLFGQGLKALILGKKLPYKQLEHKKKRKKKLKYSDIDALWPKS